VNLTAPTADTPANDARRIELTPANTIRSERVRWFVEGSIPLRGLTVFCGEKGLGKSLETNARLPASATRGRLRGDLAGQPIDVLLATAEDDWATVVKPRLLAHDADLTRVHRVRVLDDAGASLLTFPDDVSALTAEITRLRDAGRPVGLLCIDPIGAFISANTDTHRDASVRRALAPLAAMAEALDLAVVVVAHLTKDESSRLINRVSGAGAFVNAARSMLALARNPDDPDGERGSERVLVHVASNWGKLAPSLAMRVESRDVTLDDGTVASVGHMQLVGETDVAVEDLQRGRDETGSADVQEAIGAALAAGPKPSREIKAQIAGELRCSHRTLERAAVRMVEYGELSITSGGFPRTTTWSLSDGVSLPATSADSSDKLVATGTNTLSVATSSADVVTDFSGSSSDTWECQDGTVATEADQALAHVLEKFPDLAETV
jgi:hypothetical protein